ncbi:M23 family metallopeptidase [Hymenobacter endophyticus]|uniref:M23 family metallopeptidase n=1 Tax=Hymenobacter endophyticus TaxID=3076335 RepID=A0ABU3TF93_9BACT|nr:M23 family metallopeptidase [Hymenobacter endophyticus]MDU0370052.1 M23 family metallopeptidase [Hymenobacter endophyticus]
MKIAWVAAASSLLLLAHTPGSGQVRPYKIYQVKHEDGRVFIVGENYGPVPFSVILRVKLVSMRSSVPLPARVALPPDAAPHVLVTLTPEKADFSYRYSTQGDVGVYTGQVPDSLRNCPLPFQAAADTIRPREKAPHQYAFALPNGTPIVAVRAGTVAYVRQDQKNARSNEKGNTVFIYHSDGTYGSYSNLAQHGATVQVGQAVQPGQVIGRFGGNKYETNFWFTLVYLTPTGVAGSPILFQRRETQP